MVAIPFSVSIGNHKDATVIDKIVCEPDCLVEKDWCPDIEAVRAVAAHAKFWIKDVATVVLRIQRLSIPAGRKHKFKANAIKALGIEECLIAKVMVIH